MKIYGITMGDASGVGPEIVLKAARDGDLRQPSVVFGDYSVLDRANRELSFGVQLRRVAHPSEWRPEAGLAILDHNLQSASEVTPGQLNKAAGHAAREYVISAAKSALAGDIAAMVTLPMNKEATQLTDPRFTGHTELIGEVCGVADVTIMLASPSLIVTHVSTHCSLREAIERCKKPRISTIVELTWHAVRRLNPEARIAVAGLNPHAGEHGLFGDEEILEIAPAVEWARSQGYAVDGPLPPDTLFYLAVVRKKYDAIVCMYHDQGHIPSKLLDFEGGVNIALGLPIVRTSVDHGTAFDIAWKGVASTRSFLCAMDFAERLTR
ncbi:MAG: 4-hydroxythreonine-4-phosphate dehydrogenase PdxA [Bryobacteraceae bacterium]|nr:4-hydroxythreonine-4-phosphate dehydrogenase PdxA [Bryobacteraceae bacterium]